MPPKKRKTNDTANEPAIAPKLRNKAEKQRRKRQRNKEEKAAKLKKQNSKKGEDEDEDKEKDDDEDQDAEDDANDDNGKGGEEPAEGAKDDAKDEDTAPKEKVVEPAIQYLELWSKNRSAWKFKKVRQIWLLKCLYDHKKISAAHFAMLLEYMEPLKGISREKAIEEARKITDQFEADSKAAVWCEPAEHKLKKRKYKRALKILEKLS